MKKNILNLLTKIANSVQLSLPYCGALKVSLNDENILLTAVKPALSGNGIIVRLYNVSSSGQKLQLKCNHHNRRVSQIHLSNAREKMIEPFDLQGLWPAFSLKTLFILV
ncbi:hypothetical protein H8S90_20150 [Olivibacter sp. SDN3]|uniref:glycosyl hydrolase-related protein n=1 Tax=Olivibacter sp. SDN3 TaxID=2764720 RepID=UPI0016512E65|nr:glycosyl hydrolase-related protein [Olivibacter sp. SDN3]QNL49038.1 hypothetical protein H8S90_20150 [Olivibacter sp. SDN3]